MFTRAKQAGLILVSIAGLVAANSTVGADGFFTPAHRKHWSIQKITQPAVPAVSNKQWVRNPIDAFITAKLEANKIQPSAEADRATLLRRVSFDLIGLPPTPEEVEAFVADRSPDANEKVVDRLLAFPPLR
jgi:hypothetical protein